MVNLVDTRGRPIKQGALKEPQTARLGSLRREIGSHPVRGLTPGRLAIILEDAERGELIAQMDLFEELEERDGHILAELGKRKRAVTGLDWDIVAPRDATPQEEDHAAWVKQALQDMPKFSDLLLDMLDAIGKGFSNCEIDWDRSEGEWMPAAIDLRPARWFTVDKETRTELRLRTATNADGEPLQPFGWVSHVHKAKSGYITRAGLGRCLVWPFLFKNYSVRDLAEFLEIYGLPLRVGTYPSGATDDEKATLLQAVVNIGHAAAGIIPEGMMIDFKEAAEGAAGPYQAMIDWCERTQSKAIVGQVLSAEAKSTGLGSGVANVQNEVRWDLTVADAGQLAGTITRDLVYPLLVLNRGGVDSLRRCPRFVFDTTEVDDFADYAEPLTKLAGAGLRIPTRYVHERFRIPEAEDDEPVLTAPQPAPLPGPFPAPRGTGTGPASLRGCPSCGGHHAALKGAPTEVADAHADRLAADATAANRAWIERLRRLVDDAVANGGSLEALRDRMLEAYGDLPADELARVMQFAFAAAELAGRYDVAEQAGRLRSPQSDDPPAGR